MNSKKYSVSQLAQLSGVSVRTLHLYDEIGLLKPLSRTEAGYRTYGEQELLRLQQILLYRQLDFSLAEIRQIVDDPNFDLIAALEAQKLAFQEKQANLTQLLTSIEQTIHHLKKEGHMTNLEFLYKGIPQETADSWRKEAADKWGEDTVKNSEEKLLAMQRPTIEALKRDAEEIGAELFALRHHDPADPLVQHQVARHYTNIRAFWGTTGSKDLQADAYTGLGELYIADERFLSHEGVPQPEYALFLSKAMRLFADRSLR